MPKIHLNFLSRRTRLREKLSHSKNGTELPGVKASGSIMQRTRRGTLTQDYAELFSRELCIAGQQRRQLSQRRATASSHRGKTQDGSSSSSTPPAGAWPCCPVRPTATSMRIGAAATRASSSSCSYILRSTTRRTTRTKTPSSLRGAVQIQISRSTAAWYDRRRPIYHLAGGLLLLALHCPSQDSFAQLVTKTSNRATWCSHFTDEEGRRTVLYSTSSPSFVVETIGMRSILSFVLAFLLSVFLPAWLPIDRSGNAT